LSRCLLWLFACLFACNFCLFSCLFVCLPVCLLVCVCLFFVCLFLSFFLSFFISFVISLSLFILFLSCLCLLADPWRCSGGRDAYDAYYDAYYDACYDAYYDAYYNAHILTMMLTMMVTTMLTMTLAVRLAMLLTMMGCLPARPVRRTRVSSVSPPTSSRRRWGSSRPTSWSPWRASGCSWTSTPGSATWWVKTRSWTSRNCPLPNKHTVTI